ncbi:MAG: TlpA disulfide reductase family protein [Bacteroidota bacterium]
MKTLVIASVLFCLSWQANAQQTETIAKHIQSMAKEKDPEKNVASMHSLIKEFRLDTFQNREDIDMLKGNVALSFLKAGDHPQFEAYIAKIKNKFNQTSFLNMAVYNLFKAKAFDYAEIIAKKTVDLYESYKDDPSAKPVNFLLEDWNRFMQMAAYPYYESYAAVLHEKGQNKKALFYEEKAIQGKENLMQSSNELYAALLVADGQVDTAYHLLLKMMSVGKASIKMNALFKKLVMQKLGDEAKATLFLDSIQQNIDQLYDIEITKKMIHDVEAPNFDLLDLNGKRLALNSLKGKIVVLDFWATWCAPCIASMPAMKKISELHPEVVFLFIATQETGEDPTARVKTYVKDNKFPLNVLMDEKKSTVASAYKVTGIPTKVVIDKNGKLRFTTNGYQSDAELIDELEAMITLTKAQ